jgi:SM-20-related protein
VDSLSILQYDQIADGLASQGYACVDHFLTHEQVLAITSSDEFGDPLLQFKKAGTGHDKQISESVRGDYIQWIDRSNASPGLNVFLERASELITFVNRSLFLSIRDYELHKTVYPAGSYYKRHLDQFKSADRRKLSVICYLNNDWSEEFGGQLRIYLPEAKDIFPVGGRLVCFRSDMIEHEVLPATRNRLSLTGWFLDQEAELSYL